MTRRTVRASIAMPLALALGAVLVAAAPQSAQRRVIRPEGAPANRPYSPGVLVGETLYVSGQLGLPGTGPTPAAMDTQAHQAMDAVGAVLKAAGLGYQHLVKCHVYLADMDDYAAMNAVYGSYFTNRVPARTTVQAAALPSGAGIEIGCIAYADLARVSVVRPPAGSLPAPLGPYSPAVWAGDTLYLSGMGGVDPSTKTAGDTIEAQVTQTVANITTTLKAAGLSMSDVVWAQAYGTKPDEARALEAAVGRAVGVPRGMLVLPRLPGPIRAEVTGVATKGQGPFVYVAPAASPGDGVEEQAQRTFATLKPALRDLGGRWEHTGLVTVYLSDIADLPRLDAVFREAFPRDPPARVTIQVQPQAQERVRIGLVAGR